MSLFVFLQIFVIPSIVLSSAPENRFIAAMLPALTATPTIVPAIIFPIVRATDTALVSLSAFYYLSL